MHIIVVWWNPFILTLYQLFSAPNIDLSQEEVWAAKARAWAASKVVQDEPSSAPAAIQPYPEYGQHKQQDEHHMEEKKHQESGEHNPPPRQGFEKPLVMLEPNIDGSDQKSALGRQSPHLINEIQVITADLFWTAGGNILITWMFCLG